MSFNVKLISKTITLVDGLKTAEDLLAYVARVSNEKNQLNTKTASKLIKYLMAHKHWSPFQMIYFCMEINTARDIGRQILRHTSFDFQEFSQRYAKVESDSFELKECRLQDNENRQNSIETTDELVTESWREWQEQVLDFAKYTYSKALAAGVAKEQARAILPEGLTKTRMYMNGSLRSWIHYCQLRMGNGTQKEHQDIAKECWEILIQEVPCLNLI